MNGVEERLTGWPERDRCASPWSTHSASSTENASAMRGPGCEGVGPGAAVGLADHTALSPGTERREDRRQRSPIHDAAGNVVGVVLVFRDVTHERQAEDACGEAKSVIAC